MFIFWSLSALAQATIHVPKDQPTIQAGIDAARDGGTVLVMPGTYNENIDFKGKNITVTSGATTYTGAAGTVINAAAPGPVVTFQSNETTAVLNGFTIQNGTTSSSSGYAVGVYIASSAPTISNNIVANNTGCGISISNKASPLVEGNDIRNNGAAPGREASLCNAGQPGTGLAIESAGRVRVIGNIVENNSVSTAGVNIGSGIYLNGPQDVLLLSNIVRNNYIGPGLTIDAGTRLTMVQNLIYGNAEGRGDEVFLGGNNPNQSPPTPTLVEINNTIYGGGEEIAFSFAPSLIENNIFINISTNASWGTYSGLACGLGTQSSITLSHNDIFNYGAPRPTYCPTGTANLSTDPMFLDPATENFRTQPTSPVVAEGDIGAPDIPFADLDQKARTVCGTIDMGVYEVRPHPPIALQQGVPNPVVGGSPVTFAAQLTGNCNTPTGLLTFMDGAMPLGTAPLNSSAAASFTTSSLTVGTHTITATYPGDFNFEGSTSNPVTELVTGYPTQTALQVSPNPANAFQTITLSAVVSSQFGVPNGTVTFMAGANALGTAPLSTSGAAAITNNKLGVGTYNITAVYNASTNFAASTSAATQEQVIGAQTTTTLASTPNPAYFGQTVTFTAAVTAPQSTATPTGTIVFKDGPATLGSSAIGASGAAAPFSTSTLALGSHTITAVYSGSPNDNPSSSNPVVEAVEPAPTAVSLTASPSPANMGQLVTLTATVVTSVAGLPSPAGTVVFADQFGTIGTAQIAAGIATFATSTLAVGTHNITALFTGGGSYAANTSAAVAEVVQLFDFSMAVSSTSLTIPSGGYQVLTVKLTPLGGFNHAVALSCSSVPADAQCVFNPSSTTKPLADGTQTMQLVLNTSTVYEYGNQVGRASTPAAPGSRRRSPFVFALLLPLFALYGPLGAGMHRLRNRMLPLLLFGLLTGALLLQGCTGKLPGTTPPGSYTVTVAATDASGQTTLVHTTDIKLAITK